MIRSPFPFAALYAAAFLVLVDQATDLGVALYPFRFGVVSWRFSALGLATGRTTAVVLADALLITAALGFGHRRFLVAWAFAHWILAIFLLVALAGFGLDTLELRPGVELERRLAFLLASGRAGLMVVLSTCYCVMGGWFAYRGGRLKEKRSKLSPALVVGGTSP